MVVVTVDSDIDATTVDITSLEHLPHLRGQSSDTKLDKHLSFQNSQNSSFESKQSIAFGGDVLDSFCVVISVAMSVVIVVLIDSVVLGKRIPVVVVGVGKLKVVVRSCTLQDRHVN